MFSFEVYKLLLKLIRCYDLCLGREKWAELRHLNGFLSSEMDWHHFIMLSVQYVHLHIKWMIVMHIKELAYRNMHVSLEVAVSFGLCWSILRQNMNMQLTDCSEGHILYSKCWAELCCCTLGLAGNRLAHIPCEHNHRCQNWSWYWRDGDFVALSWFRNSQKLHLQISEHRTSANASNSGVIVGLFPSSDGGGLRCSYRKQNCTVYVLHGAITWQFTWRTQDQKCRMCEKCTGPDTLQP